MHKQDVHEFKQDQARHNILPRDVHQFSQWHGQPPWLSRPQDGVTAKSKVQRKEFIDPLTLLLNNVSAALPRDQRKRPTPCGAGGLGLLYNLGKKIRRMRLKKNLEAAAIQMRQLRKKGEALTEIGFQFGISIGTVRKIVQGNMREVCLGGGHAKHGKYKDSKESE